MNERSSVLIDNTTVDSAIRMLSSQERERRRIVGWCLRDISDLSCLACYLDALIYFDDLFVVPADVFPTTEHIASTDSASDQLRGFVNPLPLRLDDWDVLAENTRARVTQMLSAPDLRAQIAMPSLGRTVYKWDTPPNDYYNEMGSQRNGVNEMGSSLRLTLAQN